MCYDLVIYTRVGLHPSPVNDLICKRRHPLNFLTRCLSSSSRRMVTARTGGIQSLWSALWLWLQLQLCEDFIRRKDGMHSGVLASFLQATAIIVAGAKKQCSSSHQRAINDHTTTNQTNQHPFRDWQYVPKPIQTSKTGNAS